MEFVITLIFRRKPFIFRTPFSPKSTVTLVICSVTFVWLQVFRTVDLYVYFRVVVRGFVLPSIKLCHIDLLTYRTLSFQAFCPLLSRSSHSTPLEEHYLWTLMFRASIKYSISIRFDHSASLCHDFTISRTVVPVPRRHHDIYSISLPTGCWFRPSLFCRLRGLVDRDSGVRWKTRFGVSILISFTGSCLESMLVFWYLLQTIRH